MADDTPNMTDYEKTRREFELKVPERFNFGFDIVDEWAKDRTKLALVSVGPDDVVQKFVGERPFIEVEGHMGKGELRLNPEMPLTMGPLDLQDFYYEHKIHQVDAME